MKVLLILWIFYPVVSGTEDWMIYSGRSYAIFNTKLDFATSCERCSDYDAGLAIFLPSYNFTDFVSELRLGPDTRYWISVGKPDYLFNTCNALSVLRQRLKWLLLGSNCSAPYQFICEREPNQKFHPPAPVTTAPTRALGGTTEHALINASPTCKGEKCRNKKNEGDPVTRDITHQLETSFKTNTVSPTSFIQTLSTLLPEFSTWTQNSPNSSKYSETHLQINSELGKGVYGNLSQLHLCQLCREYIRQEFLTQDCDETYNDTLHNDDNDSLVINLKETNKYRRQLTSADDQRMTSKAMGVAAVIVIATVLLCIAAMDAPILIHAVHAVTANLYRWLKF